MRSLIFVYIIEEDAHTHGQGAPRLVLANTRARSHAEAVEHYLLVAYPVIDIHGMSTVDLQQRACSTILIDQ